MNDKGFNGLSDEQIKIIDRDMMRWNESFSISKTHQTILKFFSDTFYVEEFINKHQLCFIVFFENRYEIYPANKYNELFHTGVATWIPPLGDDCLEQVNGQWLNDTLIAFKKYYKVQTVDGIQ